MQFKNPEVLYFLALLIIPIIIHLFQLQKFVKVPFTNVAFLQKLVQQTRKSSRIKKWLILTTRLLLFLAILFAFSQPYISNKKSNKKQHYYIYLDNSLSTNTKGEKGNLLKVATQEILDNISDKNLYSLHTNSNFYENISTLELKKRLLNLKETAEKIDLSTILLKFKAIIINKTNSLNNIVLISDFQNTYIKEFTDVTPSFSTIKLEPSIRSNISIDSVFINNNSITNFTVNVVVKNQGEEKNTVPIAIYNQSKLISKLSSSFDKDSKKTIQFKVQNEDEFNGKIEITFSDTYSFDNSFYFSLKNNQKVNVLSLGKEAVFLSKIYNEDEFNFSFSSVQETNYNNILKQQLIILNELVDIPEVLSEKLIEFSNNGGNLVIILNEKLAINSYNSFLKKLNIGKIQPKQIDTIKITSINYDHPLFKNVFSKKVTNFQYPTVQSYFPVSSEKGSNIVLFENNTPFISQYKNPKSNIYLVSSSLNRKNSNFINSPLIVPVFYNFGKLSFKYPKLYYRVGTENTIDIETNIDKDKVLKINTLENSFIPLQQSYQNKVTITTKEQPLKAGFYNVIKENDSLQKLAYNYPASESLLNFMDVNELKKQHKNISISTSVVDVFKEINKKNEVHWLWKWFLALAIVSLLLEILILKFYKP